MKLTDAVGRTCVYVPITENGKVVDSKGYVLDPVSSDQPIRNASARG